MLATRKGKTVVGATSHPAKRACPVEEMSMIPPPPAQPTVEELAHLQLESSALGASTSSPAFEPPIAIPTSFEPTPTSVGAKSSWPPSIQCLILVLN